jgi:hypothetical protein
METTGHEDGHVTQMLSRLRGDEPALRSRAPWLTAVIAMLWAVVAGFAFAALPGVALWIISDDAAGSAAAPLRLGGTVWLAAHRVPIGIDDATLQLAPGGLSLLILAVLYRAGRWAAHGADLVDGRAAGAVVAPAVVGYGVVGALVAVASATDHASAVPAQAAVWSSVVATVGLSAGVFRESGLIRPALRGLPSWVQGAIVGSVVMVLALCVVGAALVAVSVVVHSGDIRAATDALDPDATGAVVLVALNLALAVNAVVWGAAYALGPGFAVGVGTMVSPGAVDVGPVPIVPLFGALPAQPVSGAGWLVFAGPVVAGCLAGVVISRRASMVPRVQAAGIGLAAGALAGVVMSMLALVSGGSAGAARLSQVGSVPWEVAAMTFLVVGVPAMITATLLHWRGSRTAEPGHGP